MKSWDWRREKGKWKTGSDFVRMVGKIVKMKNNRKEKKSIEIYQQKDSTPEIEVLLEEDTVWLNQTQFVELFQRDQSVISRNINNVFKEGELDKESNMHFLHIPNSDKPVAFYNLDVIISVGYRVKSKIATQFRIWATNVLKKHLVKGYTINEKRLKTQAHKYRELQNSVKLLENVLALDKITQEQARGIIEVVTDYAYALDVLDRYDFKKLSLKKTTKKELYKLDYDKVLSIIQNLKKQFGESDLFGIPKDDSFKSSVSAIYQSVGRKDAYSSIEEKAAHLLYFVTKNHSFIDGNKRIAATLFVHFLN